MALALTHPVPGSIATDSFGWRAAIPGVVDKQLHTGQDYAAPEGTPIRAAHSGRVSRTWWDTMVSGAPAGGNMIEIGAARCVTRYAHAARYIVSAGDHVKSGQIIGYVGSTGAATGPHLHFELILNGGFVDPRPYMKETPMTKSEMRQLADMILDTEITRHGSKAEIKRLGKTTTLRKLVAKSETLHKRTLRQRLKEAVTNAK